MLERLDGEDAEHFAEVRRLLDQRRDRLRARPDAWCAGSTTTRARCSSSPPTRSAPSAASAAAAATTASSSSSAARRRPASGWAAGIERIAAGARRGRRPSAAARRVRRRARAAQRERALGDRHRAAPRGALGATLDLARPQPQGPDEAGRPGRRPSRRDPRRGWLRRRLRDMATGEQREVDPAGEASGGAAMTAKRSPRSAQRSTATRWCGQVLRRPRRRARSRVAGWVHRRRDHGGLVFVDLRDRTGLVQLVFNPEPRPRPTTSAHQLRAEDVLSRRGRGRQARSGDRQPRAADRRGRGARRRGGGPRRRRHAAVRDRELRRARSTRSCGSGTATSTCAATGCARRSSCATASSAAIREFLDAEGLPRGRDADPDPLDARGRARLRRAQPHAARLVLRAAAVAAALQAAADGRPGYERYYQIARCFRDEDLRADRQPEFTQLDLEMSFVDDDDVIDVTERLLAHASSPRAGVEIELPLPRLAYDEAIARFGTDRPDIRFGLEIRELSPTPCARPSSRSFAARSRRAAWSAG